MSNNIIMLSAGKFELGPHLNNGLEMNWWGFERELEKLNSSLAEGEKPWKIISMEEFQEIGKRIEEIRATSDSREQKNAKVLQYVEGLGILWSRAYWSGTSAHDYPRRAWSWDSYDGRLDEADKISRAIARVIRPIV